MADIKEIADQVRMSLQVDPEDERLCCTVLSLVTVVPTAFIVPTTFTYEIGGI